MSACLRNLNLILKLDSFIHLSKIMSLLIDLSEIYDEYPGIFNSPYNLECVSQQRNSLLFPELAVCGQ